MFLIIRETADSVIVNVLATLELYALFEYISFVICHPFILNRTYVFKLTLLNLVF